MEKFTVSPNATFSHLKIEIETDRNMPVVVVVQDSATKVVSLLHWQLIAGTNVTCIYGLEWQEGSKYKVGILDKDFEELFSTILCKPVIETEAL